MKKVADIAGKQSVIKDSKDGFRITAGKGQVLFFSAKRMPVDLKKKYMVSCEYRLAPGAKSSDHFYVAPVCYDKNGKMLEVAPQYCIVGTDTVLAAAAKKGDKILKVKDGQKWQKNWYAAFNTKKDYSDLPNTALVRIGAIVKKGDVWEVELKTPLAKDYPAGTAVRNHRSGATYRYLLYTVPKAEWQKTSKVFSGVKADHSTGSWNSWRINTVQAGFVFFTTGKPVDMEIRNMSITEVK